MVTTHPYKVLWVDDDDKIVASTILDAEDYNLELVRFSNWEEAEISLKKDFDEYSAIILDANCKINKDSLEQEEFITAVLPSLSAIFGQKRKELPWYILSAGTMATFNNVVTGAKYQHAKHEEEWGNMLYLKDAPDNSEQCSSRLFEQINAVAKDSSLNVILYRHADVFKYLGYGKLIDPRARRLMLKMLSALYFPDENIKFEYTGNPLRKVVEYVFRAARKQGLLADECFDNLDHIVLLDASRFMAGMVINCYEGKSIKYKVRWGDNEVKGKDGKSTIKEADSIFPTDIAMIVKNTINYSSSDSHTDEDEPYFIDEENKEYFFAYVMQICHLIKWFGKYVEEHSDIEKNKSKKQILSPQNEVLKKVEPVKRTKADLIGKTYLVQKQNGIAVCGTSKLSEELQKTKGMVIIEELIENDGSDKEQFPYVITKIK